MTEHLKSLWRPLMAYTYMVIVICDFVLFPIGWAAIQVIWGMPAQQWVPITLDVGGVFHASMCAVVGVSAWTRGKEKIVSQTPPKYSDN